MDELLLPFGAGCLQFGSPILHPKNPNGNAPPEELLFEECIVLCLEGIALDVYILYNIFLRGVIASMRRQDDGPAIFGGHGGSLGHRPSASGPTARWPSSHQGLNAGGQRDALSAIKRVTSLDAPARTAPSSSRRRPSRRRTAARFAVEFIDACTSDTSVYTSTTELMHKL